MTQPSSQSVLHVLSKARLLDLARDLGVALSAAGTKEQQVGALLESRRVQFRELLRALGRDELKAACRAHGLDDSGRDRPLLAARLLEAHGAADSAPPPPIFGVGEAPRYAPRPGDIVACRHRQWLVETVDGPPLLSDRHTRVRLVCLDDDDSGRELEVFWELELGARVLQPEVGPFTAVEGIDEPRRFAAYLHALKWNAVTATDARLFQAPFRAGIQLMDYQLTPLMKALSLPRANLFIADDVGLGKTIEAGLVLQELLLRQQVQYVVVVCPASVALQWQGEMEKRFGLYFEVMSRSFIARVRQERGFVVNPWSTHRRFIISHPLVRRPEYREPLLRHLAQLAAHGTRAQKSLLILDEAHVAAPASASKYAVDSQLTHVIRDIAPRFENRLFLSATPHNGHSNSFSALLEILDPQRFTRGMEIDSPARLAPVMVRRLKEDLRQIGVDRFPLRRVVQLALSHEGAAWRLTEQERESAGPTRALAPQEPFELELASALAAYTALMKPAKTRGKLVFVNLQKRLLSSVEAFARTLGHHARAIEEGCAMTALQLPLGASADDESAEGPDDDVLDAEEDAAVIADTVALGTPEGEARRLLDRLVALSSQTRTRPDGKVHALLDWIRRNQCPAVRIGGADASQPAAWSDRRVLIFTEYADTKRYLRQLLAAAFEGTERGEERILELHGGMSPEAREEVQRAFNSPPDKDPVRVLLATDAAREGVNLQGHCADLVHFDIPWNPARLEQRNGRIDRTLQPAKEVRCHYFVYPQRAEDQVLEALVAKVETIERELGSLGVVLLDRFTTVLEDGINEGTAARLAKAEELGGRRETTRAELESQRHLDRIRAEREHAAEVLDRSAKVLEFDRTLFREAIDVGLVLAGAGPLEAIDPSFGKHGLWKVPELPRSWQTTLDTMRPPRAPSESLWDWRRHPPQPIAFEAPPKMNDAIVHMHLEHPFARRVLGRFLAQGYSAHDLSRVTVVRNFYDNLVRVIAFGRLSLFGRGATRLHDRLLSVAARWIEGTEERLLPFAQEADRKAIDLLERILAEAPTLEGLSPSVGERVRAAAPRLFAELWPAMRAEADAQAKDAEDRLKARGRADADGLTKILTDQRALILRKIGERAQLPLGFSDAEARQWRDDRAWLEERLDSAQKEIESEPPQLAALYDVVLRRVEPVGLVVLWPETRG